MITLFKEGNISRDYAYFRGQLSTYTYTLIHITIRHTRVHMYSDRKKNVKLKKM